MFTKYTIALSALLLVGGSMIASAAEDPESRLGDRYPFLEQAARPVTSAPQTAVRQNPTLDLYIDQDVEAKIGDRYPFLEQVARPHAPTVTQRTSMRTNPVLTLFAVEQPENRIADRYPFLEQAKKVASGPKRHVASMRTTQSGTKVQKVMVARHAS